MQAWTNSFDPHIACLFSHLLLGRNNQFSTQSSVHKEGAGVFLLKLSLPTMQQYVSVIDRLLERRPSIGEHVATSANTCAQQ